jgi:hypothetical protein
VTLPRLETNEEKKEVKYRQGRAIEAVHVNREGQKRPLN